MEYAVEGLGTFTLPEGFTQEEGEIAEPLPTTYATFEKDGYYIQANRFGTDAYEMAGVPPARRPGGLLHPQRRPGLRTGGDGVDYDDYGNYSRPVPPGGRSAVLLCAVQGESPLAVSTSPPRKISLTRTRLAQWLSGSVLE